MRLFDSVRLYVLLTESLCQGDWYITAEAALVGGAGAIQLREKHLDEVELLERAKRLRALCDEHQALFILNDRPDIALAGGAHGVHLGQQDMSAADARRLLGPEFIVGLMAEAGCTKVMVGLESGNEYLRNTLLQRSLKAEDMITALARFKKVGIETVSFNMVGLPEETPANVLETVKLNAVSNVTYPQVSIFYPFPGTALAKYCEEKGYVREFHGDVHDYFSDSSLDMPSLTRERIVAHRLSFRPFMYTYRAIYELPEPLRSVLEKLVDVIFTSRYHTFLAMKVMKPLRSLYRDGIRLAYRRVRRIFRAGSNKRDVELGAVPAIEDHDA